jgi:hypothetical protein
MTEQNEFITGKELMERWYRWDKTNPYYLAYDILKYDLTIVDRVEDLESEDEIIIGLRPGELIRLLKNPSGLLRDRVFYLHEIEETERKHRISPFAPQVKYWFHSLGTPPKSVVEAVEQFEPGFKNNKNVFFAFSKAWMAKFNDDEITFLPNQEKYRYLPNLLNPSNPRIQGKELGLEISNVELVSKVTGRDFEDGDYSISEDEENDYEEESPFENISNQEFNTIKMNAIKIFAKIKASKLSGDKQAQDEAYDIFEHFKKHLSSQGIYCKLKEEDGRICLKRLIRLKSELEKIRQRIKNQLDGAISDIEPDMPRLARHLSKSIQRKLRTTIYSPENPTEWFVSF